MVGKRAKSKFADRVSGAHKTHKSDETKVGAGGGLPPGIENGVARLTSMKVSKYEKGDNLGEPFFMAAGIVLAPDTVPVTDKGSGKTRSVPVRGLRTQIGPVPICDTTNSKGETIVIDEHWSRILNHLRLLGLKTADLEVSDIVAEPKPEEYVLGVAAEALLKEKPTFSFRTWQGKPTPKYPNPRVNEEWRGVCKFEDTATEDAVDDGTEKVKWEDQ